MEKQRLPAVIIKRHQDLNKCSVCSEDVVIGASGMIGCVNDNCKVEIIGIIYPEPILFKDCKP